MLAGGLAGGRSPAQGRTAPAVSRPIAPAATVAIALSEPTTSATSATRSRGWRRRALGARPPRAGAVCSPSDTVRSGVSLPPPPGTLQGTASRRHTLPTPLRSGGAPLGSRGRFRAPASRHDKLRAGRARLGVVSGDGANSPRFARAQRAV